MNRWLLLLVALIVVFFGGTFVIAHDKPTMR